MELKQNKIIKSSYFSALSDNFRLSTVISTLFVAIILISSPQRTNAQEVGGAGGCASCACETTCQIDITQSHEAIREHVDLELDFLRTWIVDSWFFGEASPMHALGLLTNQLTTVGVQQVKMIGVFFDAKHQLETQRLFQQLTAQAHKDYHPSEGLCEIGTGTMALAQSERISDLTKMTLTKRTMDRTMNSRYTIGGLGGISDRLSRVRQFISTFCNPEDNASGLRLLCGIGGNPQQQNMDVDYTSALENKLTLNIDMTTGGAGNLTQDEENILALNANLFANDTNTPMPFRTLADGRGNLRDAMNYHIGQRSIAAKRSVAQNSFSSIAAMRANGSGENAPFLKAAIHELGVNIADINPYLGANPSYFAQMEVLTKKLYQNPNFYADLYDKPVNIERKGVAMQAIGIMQDRDIYDSLLRSEAVLATLLETLLRDEHNRVTRNLDSLKDQDERF